ncbi:MAG: DEAD/DEAH box helicase [Pseudomonadales bacterium]|nr:DEAD/DEAH box helicase [Pseudomonadales bacterium]
MIIDLAIHKQLLRAADELGFTETTEVQAKAIPAALAGRDLIVCSKTGSGKTAAFLLPMLDQMLAHEAPKTGTRALILLPTRELALQIRKTFQAMARYTPIKCGLIMGGEAFKHQVATLRKNPEVIIATPGRLVEHIEKGTPDLKDLEILVLDEADRMLDMGFAVDMETIARACRNERQTLLFSATLAHKGMASITRLLREPQSIVIDSHRQAHDSIVQQRVLADDIKHKEKLVVALLAAEQAARTLVFCNTRKQCQELGNVLKYSKLRVDYLHGEIAQNDRKQVMNRFRSGAIEVLVATDVAARGLDIEGIELVINFNVAQSGDDHVHRIGRTGRAGQTGKAITLVSANEWNQMSSIERYLKLRFEPRKVPGLTATYRGPKKVKKSGKAAGSKKRKTSGNKKKTATSKKTSGEIGYKPLKR